MAVNILYTQQGKIIAIATEMYRKSDGFLSQTHRKRIAFATNSYRKSDNKVSQLRPKSIAKATEKYRKCDVFIASKKKRTKRKNRRRIIKKKKEKEIRLLRDEERKREKKKIRRRRRRQKNFLPIFFLQNALRFFVGKNCNIFRFSVCCGCGLIRDEPNLPLYFVSDAFKI